MALRHQSFGLSQPCDRCGLHMAQPQCNLMPRPRRRRAAQRSAQRGLLTRAMGIRAIESVDASFTLPQESQEGLHKLLSSPAFCRQVVKECHMPAEAECEFSGMLFQPVPWTPATKKGMPQEYEQYHSNPDYTIINVPPNFMFQAKIFNPSRLCAIFQKK